MKNILLFILCFICLASFAKEENYPNTKPHPPIIVPRDCEKALESKGWKIETLSEGLTERGKTEKRFQIIKESKGAEVRYFLKVSGTFKVGNFVHQEEAEYQLLSTGQFIFAGQYKAIYEYVVPATPRNSAVIGTRIYISNNFEFAHFKPITGETIQFRR